MDEPASCGWDGWDGGQTENLRLVLCQKKQLRFVTWSDSTIQLTQGSPQSQCEDDEVPPLTNCKTFFNKTEVSGFSCQKEHTPGANRWNPKNHLRWKGKSSSKNLHFLGSMFIFRVYFQQFRWWKNKNMLQEESAVAVHRIAMAARRYATGSPMLNLMVFLVEILPTMLQISVIF